MNKSTSDWINYWRRNTAELSPVNTNPTYFQKIVIGEIRKQVGRSRGLRLLSAGCGLDIISLNLIKQLPSFDVTLLDISEECINACEQIFATNRLSAKFLVGNIFKTDFAENSFDIVYNTGVMEHFTEEEQQQITDEMVRILKPGGVYMTFNPSQKGVIYVSGKKCAEDSGVWEYGIENPILSLKWLSNRNPQIDQVKE